MHLLTTNIEINNIVNIMYVQSEKTKLAYFSNQYQSESDHHMVHL